MTWMLCYAVAVRTKKVMTGLIVMTEQDQEM